jgi:hypothetical protein
MLNESAISLSVPLFGPYITFALTTAYESLPDNFLRIWTPAFAAQINASSVGFVFFMDIFFGHEANTFPPSALPLETNPPVTTWFEQTFDEVEDRMLIQAAVGNMYIMLPDISPLIFGVPMFKIIVSRRLPEAEVDFVLSKIDLEVELHNARLISSHPWTKDKMPFPYTIYVNQMKRLTAYPQIFQNFVRYKILTRLDENNREVEYGRLLTFVANDPTRNNCVLAKKYHDEVGLSAFATNDEAVPSHLKLLNRPFGRLLKVALEGGTYEPKDYDALVHIDGLFWLALSKNIIPKDAMTTKNHSVFLLNKEGLPSLPNTRFLRTETKDFERIDDADPSIISIRLMYHFHPFLHVFYGSGVPMDIIYTDPSGKMLADYIKLGLVNGIDPDTMKRMAIFFNLEEGNHNFDELSQMMDLNINRDHPAETYDEIRDIVHNNIAGTVFGKRFRDDPSYVGILLSGPSFLDFAMLFLTYRIVEPNHILPNGVPLVIQHPEAVHGARKWDGVIPALFTEAQLAHFQRIGTSYRGALHYFDEWFNAPMEKVNSFSGKFGFVELIHPNHGRLWAEVDINGSRATIAFYNCYRELIALRQQDKDKHGKWKKFGKLNGSDSTLFDRALEIYRMRNRE